MKEKELFNVVENKPDYTKVDIITSSELKELKLTSFDLFTKIVIFRNCFMTIFPYIFGSLAIILYTITLKGCTGTQFECVQIITNDVIKKMLTILFLSALALNLQIMLYIYNREYLIPFILTSSSFIFLCFIYDTGADFDSHGAYNRLLLFFFSLIWAGIYLAFRIVFHFMKKFPIVTTISLIIICFFLHQTKVSIFENSCEGWEVGLKGVKIDNTSGTSCKIRPPKVCYFKILDGYLNISKLLGEKCENMNTNKLSNNIDHLKDKSALVIGYPRTEHYKYFPNSQENIFQKNVMKDIINMEDPKIDTKVKNKVEVTTNYKFNPPKVNIELKRNESLVKNRAIKWEKAKKDALTKNVLHIFIDSVSRANFKRKMPQLNKWLEDLYSTDKEKVKGKKIESFQFMKFHGLGTFTGINMVPAVFGVYNVFYDGRHYITDYKSKGYITGQATGYCGREIFGMDPGAIKNLAWDHFDHELASFYCDGNYTPYDDMYAILVGINSPRIRCLYNRSIASYNLEYASQFFQQYKNEPKFFRMMFYEAHEGTQEVIKTTDGEITNFLRGFEKQGLLEDTTVVIQTDHGLGMAGVYSGLDLEDYHKETVLPSLFLVLPKKIKNYETIRTNLKYNEQSMVTHFTVFNTFHALIGGKRLYSYNDEFDLLNSKIPRSRNCNQLKSNEYWNWYTFHCRCEDK